MMFEMVTCNLLTHTTYRVYYFQGKSSSGKYSIIKVIRKKRTSIYCVVDNYFVREYMLNTN